MNDELIAYFLAAAYGLFWVIGRSKISLGVRKWLAQEGYREPPMHYVRHRLLALIECAGCVGFWEGYLYVARRSWATFFPAVLTGLLVLTTNLLLEAVVSNIKE